jgi:hypothetical protein
MCRFDARDGMDACTRHRSTGLKGLKPNYRWIEGEMAATKAFLAACPGLARPVPQTAGIMAWPTL